MFQYKCLNPISQTGLGLFGEEYKQTEELNDADAVLVRVQMYMIWSFLRTLRLLPVQVQVLIIFRLSSVQKMVSWYLILQVPMQMV